MNAFIDIHPNVLKALRNGQPVVALESTIISHGMPYPDNVRMALTVEKIVEQVGSTAATIAIIGGRIKVGLSPDEIDRLAQANDVHKVSKRDLAYVVSQNKTGATTVSATILIAAMVGIHVFATGGIGGVHRGATETFDISRDLEELATQDVCVVCAGAKSILDLGLTLEYLETKGVEVLGYKTTELPAFYTRTSGFNVDYQLDDPQSIAKLLKTKWAMHLKGGVVVANPIAYIDSLDPLLIEQELQKALEAAKKEHITGKEITPFLLKYMRHLTDNKTLKANIELVYNNARLAAEIAKCFAKM